MYRINQCLAVATAATLCVFTASQASASTIVKMQFNLSLSSEPYDTIYLELFDDTPVTQANFLNYVNDGDYDGVIMHRLVAGFVLQGGGFDLDLNAIENDGTIVNEFNRSNVRGTLAMAKVGNDPDSATNQFFFNLADNSGTPPLGLDYQNGGFTVFARVLGNGMTLIDALAGLPTINLGSPFDEIPVYPGTSGNIPLYMESVTVTELKIGDTDLNGSVDGADADLLASTLTGGTDEPQFDVDQNGTINQADLDLLNALLMGDIDGDGFVGLSDLDIVLGAWNQTVPVADGDGDVNNDGFVGLDDLDAVLNAWNAGTQPPPAAGTPEPASAALLGLLTAVAALRRRG